MKQCTLLAALILAPFLAGAQKSPGEAATIQKIESKGAAKPGGDIVVEVKVAIEKGYHSHSNKPSQPEFIPTVLTLGPLAGVTVDKIEYPPGKAEKVAGLEKPLSVYEHEFVITARLKLGKEVKLPAVLPAVLGYQACKGATCFRPQKLKFEIPVSASN